MRSVGTCDQARIGFTFFGDCGCAITVWKPPELSLPRSVYHADERRSRHLVTRCRWPFAVSESSSTTRPLLGRNLPTFLSLASQPGSVQPAGFRPRLFAAVLSGPYFVFLLGFRREECRDDETVGARQFLVDHRKVSAAESLPGDQRTSVASGHPVRLIDSIQDVMTAASQFIAVFQNVHPAFSRQANWNSID